MEVKIADFTEVIDKILDEYGDGVGEIIGEEVEKIGKEINKELKAKSPKRYGGYAKGWRLKINKTRGNVSLVAFNAKKPQLTHLLENGHAKKDGTGWVDGIPHIEPVNDWAQKTLEERIIRRI